ncbi:carbamoyl-phosphate synthase domain-containing protein [Chloroflexota bacterium]
MVKRAILVLEDGSVYEGYAFGAGGETCGEVVFNTSMMGYQEMLTDPSYAGQIVVPTYPLIGNYGINEQDFESNRIQVRGFVFKEECYQPNHYLSTRTIHEYLAESNIPAIYGVDTRAITRELCSAGVMMGMITSDKTPQQALEEIKILPDYGPIDFTRQVTTDAPYEWEPNLADADSLCNIVVLDCGLKYTVLRMKRGHGCRVTAVPSTMSASEILDIKLDGTVNGVVNTITGGHIPLRDGFQIRRATAEKRISCYTSLDTAQAAVEVLVNGSQSYSVQPLPDYRRKKPN